MTRPPLAERPALSLRLDPSFQFTTAYALGRRDVAGADAPVVVSR